MKKYRIKKQWRAVGACEFDVFFRDTKRELAEIDIAGHPEEVYAVIHGGSNWTTDGQVVADCYSRAHAVLVRDALNARGKYSLSAREHATVLAALRCWQQSPARGDCELDTIASNDGAVKPLNADDIDELCERLTCTGGA